MITEQTIENAKSVADELRQRGESERAQAIDTLIESVRGNSNGASQAIEPVAIGVHLLSANWSVSEVELASKGARRQCWAAVPLTRMSR
jgi:hypothetical protein